METKKRQSVVQCPHYNNEGQAKPCGMQNIVTWTGDHPPRGKIDAKCWHCKRPLEM